MAIKSIIGATCACLMIAAFNINAAVISPHWLASGDKLITSDRVNGNDWPDLSEINALSYDFISNPVPLDAQHGPDFHLHDKVLHEVNYRSTTSIVPTADSVRQFNAILSGSSSGYGYLDNEMVQARMNKKIQVRSYLRGTSAIPVPATVWLFGSALLGLLGLARKNTYIRDKAFITLQPMV